jgi:hypothetical protein
MSGRLSGFPEHVSVVAALGFVLSSASIYLWRGSPHAALMQGIMAATATLIEAVIRPSIHSISPTNRAATLAQSLVPRLVTCALALAIAPRFEMSYTTSLTTFAIFSVATYIGVAFVQRIISEFFLYLATVTAPNSDEAYKSSLMTAFSASTLSMTDHLKGDVVRKEAMLFLF